MTIKINIPSRIIHGNEVIIASNAVTSSNVATTLFIKCTLIGIRILSVFKYKIHMHIPNKNALTIPPKSWPMANRMEDINIAGTIPILIFSLLNRTPLNTNSSIIGANTTDVMRV